MGFFVLLLLIVGLIIIALRLSSKQQPKKELSNKVVVFKKQCPPHQWFWQEIEDQNGVSQGVRLVCKVCGPLQSQSGREEDEQ